MTAVYVVGMIAAAVVLLVTLVLYRGRLTDLSLSVKGWTWKLGAKADEKGADARRGPAVGDEHRPGRLSISGSRIRDSEISSDQPPDVQIGGSKVRGFRYRVFGRDGEDVER